jgi:hypothetical protein
MMKPLTRIGIETAAIIFVMIVLMIGMATLLGAFVH